tara:strand:+ start:23 stop:2101 length:2079 start_codon:yes stop_codon:yes gene_type:complete
MYLIKKLSIFYNHKPSESFITSIAILLSGFFILSSSSLFIGNFNKIYLLYALVTWLWLRLNEITFNFFLKKNVDKVLSFSISWIIPIILICLLGLFHFKLPIFVLAIIALLDLLFFIFFNKNSFFKLKWGNLFCIFIFGLTIIFFIAINTDHLAWIEELVYMGTVHQDTLRDAAVLNSWTQYSTISSHGVHGLLFEPYHSLYVHFLAPFINDEANVFQIFTIFANIIIPAIVVYGCSKIIISIGSSYIVKNWLFFLLFFMLTFAELSYVMHQRSFLMATLLFIAIIPLIFNIIKNPKNSNVEVILVCFLVPLILYARAFHGLFILGIFCYFLLIKKIPYKLIILSSIILSVLFLMFYYGQNQRTQDAILGNGYFLYFFLKSTGDFLDNFFIPIIIFLLIFLFKKSGLKFKFANQTNKDIFLYFVIVVCLTSLFLILISGGFSDTFFQLAPIYWFTFFFLLTPNFSQTFFDTSTQKNILRLLDKKFLIVFILFLVSIIFLQKNFYKIVNYQSYLAMTIKNFRIINNQWNGVDIRKEIFIKDIDLSVCDKEKFILACSLKKRIFGNQNFTEPSSKLFLKQMVNQVTNLAKGLNGNTAIYINPSHKFWDFEKDYGFKGKFSIFFMATAKLPIIYGAHPKNRNFNQISPAHLNGGTLKNLNEIGNDRDLCNTAKFVKIDNIIIFKEKKLTEILQCE